MRQDKQYIRFEIEDHSPYSRNHLLGVYEDVRGNEKKDRLMCFNSMISTPLNNMLVQQLANMYNHRIKQIIKNPEYHDELVDKNLLLWAGNF